MEKNRLVFEGDGILLFCEKASGFIFSPPPLSPEVSSVGIHSVSEITRVRQPGFPNVHFAAFKIRSRNAQDDSSHAPTTTSSKELVYGRKVHLFHVASGWYLSFDQSDLTGRASYEMARLVKNKNQAGVFRVIPSDTTKSTGQAISVEDVVRLEIADSPGHRSQVLCAPNIFNLNGYDLKKAADGSDFTIYSQSSGEKLGPPLALRGGEVVMFLNEKRDAFITVSKETDFKLIGKVSEQTEGTGQTDVDSYWQIENATTQYDGNWVEVKISWHIRIKHLPTKQYLILVQDETTEEKQLKLVKDGSSDDAVFYLDEDQSDVSGGLLKRRYVMIKHVKTETYITLDGKAGSRINSNRSRCFNICLDPKYEEVSEHRDQLFWIQEVDEMTLKKFSALAGAFITLKEYLEKLKEGDTGMSVVAMPTHMLDALADWTTVDQGTVETWPDMLRAMEGVELVLEFLSRPVDDTNRRIQKKLCLILENFIEFASEEAQQYLISQDKLLSCLFTLMSESVGAEELLSQLIKCRSFTAEKKAEVLGNFFKPELILDLVLKEKKNFKFIKCLSALCISGGRAERIVQRDLVDKLIIPAHQQGLFFRIQKEGPNSVSVQPPIMLEGVTDREILDLCLIAQIDFYAAVCEGVNLYCIEKLTQCLEGQEQIICYNSANLCIDLYCDSPSVQSAFYNFLVCSLVDKNAEESGTDLENIWYIYSWSRFLDKDTAFLPVTMSAIANTHDIISDKEEMIKMQNIIQASLETRNWSADIETGRENLMTQKLRVLETLVAYGFYWTADAEHDVDVPSPGVVIKALIDIIGYRYTSSDKTKMDTIAKLQSQAILILRLFLHQTCYLATARMIYDYRYFHEDQVLTEDNQNGFAVPKGSLRQLTRGNFELGKQYMFAKHIPHVRRHLIDQRVTEARDRLRWLLYEEEFDSTENLHLHVPGLVKPEYDYRLLNIYDESSSNLLSYLINFWSSDNEYLCIAAAKMFFDLFQGEELMFERSEKALIVTRNNETSWDTYTTMVKYATYQDKLQSEYVRCLLRLMQAKGTDPRIKPSIISFANEVISTSGPQGVGGLFPRDETITNTIGQNIILTTGVFQVLLNYVIRYSLCVVDDDQIELMEKICTALKIAVRNNNNAKLIVFERFDDLLSARVCMSAIAHLMTEVLSDNIELCRRLPSTTIRRMFRMATIREGLNHEYYELIPAIEAWIKISKSAPQLLKVHQRTVTVLIEQYFKDHYETSWDPNQSPFAIIDEDNDLFLLIVHLLGVCVEGTHKYSEDFARDKFNFSSLTKLLSNEDIPFVKRLPFAILLNEGFIKTERESLMSVLEFAQDRYIWSHIDTMIQLIQKISEKLASINGNKKSVMWHTAKVRVLFSQHMTHTYWKSHKIFKVNLKSTLKEEEIVGPDGTKHPLGILYQYIIEGLLPLVSGFAGEYKLMLTHYGERLGSHCKPLSDERTDRIKLFGQEIEGLVKANHNIFITSENQRIFWENTLRPIVCFSCQRETYHLNIEPSVHEPEKGDDQLAEEEINNDFQTYVRNFKSLINHSNTDDDHASVFPKGPGFKLLVNQLFDKELSEKNMTHIKYLVNLLTMLHTNIRLPHSSVESHILTDLLISVLQVLSGVLDRENNRSDEENEDPQKKPLYNWQKAFIKNNVHKMCMEHLNSANDEVVLQVLNLLRLIALDANLKSQDMIIDCIDDRDSMFCYRVYCLLEGVISTFTESWAVKATKRDIARTKKEQSIEDGTEEIDGSPLSEDDGIKLVPLGVPEIRLSTTSIETITTGTLELDSLDDSIRTASIVLDCIASLCDGQHLPTQKYLLDQDGSFKKLDIIKRIAILLDVLTDEYEKTLKLGEQSVPTRVFKYLDLIQKTIQALIETTAGNFKNQQAVFQCQITDTVNFLLSNLVDIKIPMDDWSEESKIAILDKKKELSSKSIELLEVLLEETDDKSSSLITNFCDDVDLDSIMKAMLEWEDIGGYHILRIVANCREMSVDRLVYSKMLKWPQQYINLWKDFKARSRCIEVLYKPHKETDKKILTKVYFDFDPLYEIDEDEKEIVTNAITEESLEENLTEFNEWGRSIRNNAKYIYENFINNHKMMWLYWIFYESSAPRNLALIILTIYLNFLVLASFVVPNSEKYAATNDTPNIIALPAVPYWYDLKLCALGVLHILLSLFMVIEFIIVEKPNFTKKVFFVTLAEDIWKSFKKWFSQRRILRSLCPVDWRLRQKERQVPDHIKQALLSEDTEDAVMIDDEVLDELYYYEEDDDEGYFSVDVFSFQPLYRFLFLACSLAAIPLRGYPYCICLFYVLLKVDVVQYILVALSRSSKQLLFVFFIGATTLLAFAMGAFIFLHDYFEPSQPLYCNTLWQCFISVSREGLLDTLGPAIPLSIDADSQNPSFTHYALRTLLYDVPFFIIVTTIILNIVTAVLIDRFSDLREERDAVESKKMKACFICGLESEKFERFGKGFRDHVKEDHNKWNYIYYLIYLDRKPRNDLTALEKQIADDNKIDKRYGKTDHYPIKRAKVLPKDQQSQDEDKK